ncbi:MAG: membrane protein insertase YidC [Solobacterium sp.]|nr:membrane protein insertase YidC [Solobacterium sp.]
MKMNSRTRKLLLLGTVVLVVLTASGCAVPTDENGQVILIKSTTTFAETFQSENWFNAIFTWSFAQAINRLTPYVGVGGAIAVVTFVVNALVALATFKSTLSTQRMQLLQPELNKIQRKYEGRNDNNSKMRMGAEMQQLYRKYDVNPMSSMLTLFIQFPIIIAVYHAVHRSEAVATGTFLGVSLGTQTLAGIKSILSGDTQGWVYLGLFVVMVLLHILSTMITQIIQKRKEAEAAKKQHRRPHETDNSQMQTMMLSSMVMIFLFGLMLPLAMTLYWAINSLVMITKTLIVQKVIDASEQKGAKKK